MTLAVDSNQNQVNVVGLKVQGLYKESNIFGTFVLLYMQRQQVLVRK